MSVEHDVRVAHGDAVTEGVLGGRVVAVRGVVPAVEGVAATPEVHGIAGRRDREGLADGMKGARRRRVDAAALAVVGIVCNEVTDDRPLSIERDRRAVGRRQVVELTAVGEGTARSVALGVPARKRVPVAREGRRDDGKGIWCVEERGNGDDARAGSAVAVKGDLVGYGNEASIPSSTGEPDLVHGLGGSEGEAAGDPGALGGVPAVELVALRGRRHRAGGRAVARPHGLRIGGNAAQAGLDRVVQRCVLGREPRVQGKPAGSVIDSLERRNLGKAHALADAAFVEVLGVMSGAVVPADEEVADARGGRGNDVGGVPTDVGPGGNVRAVLGVIVDRVEFLGPACEERRVHIHGHGADARCKGHGSIGREGPTVQAPPGTTDVRGAGQRHALPCRGGHRARCFRGNPGSTIKIVRDDGVARPQSGEDEALTLEVHGLDGVGRIGDAIGAEPSSERPRDAVLGRLAKWQAFGSRGTRESRNQIAVIVTVEEGSRRAEVPAAVLSGEVTDGKDLCPESRKDGAALDGHLGRVERLPVLDGAVVEGHLPVPGTNLVSGGRRSLHTLHGICRSIGDVAGGSSYGSLGAVLGSIGNGVETG